MRIRPFLDRISKRAPVIVIFTLCAALVGAWSDAPVWLTDDLAIIVGALALLLLASRRRRNLFEASEDSDAAQSRGWIAHELAGNGTPPGFYPLGFFGIVTIVLTGIQSPPSRPAWAALFLGIVWGIVNAHYPANEAPER